MENTLNKRSLSKATKLLEVLYLPESRKLIKIMESHESIESIDLLIQTGWQEEKLSKHSGNPEGGRRNRGRQHPSRLRLPRRECRIR